MAEAWQDALYQQQAGTTQANYNAQNTALAARADVITNRFFGKDPYSAQNLLKRALAQAKSGLGYQQAASGQLYSGSSETQRAHQGFEGGGKMVQLQRDYQDQRYDISSQQLALRSGFDQSMLGFTADARSRYTDQQRYDAQLAAGAAQSQIDAQRWEQEMQLQRLSLMYSTYGGGISK